MIWLILPTLAVVLVAAVLDLAWLCALGIAVLAVCAVAAGLGVGAHHIPWLRTVTDGLPHPSGLDRAPCKEHGWACFLNDYRPHGPAEGVER